MDLSCPFLHFCFTSDPLFLTKPPWPKTLNRSEQYATMSFPTFYYRVFCCPAGEFSKQLSAYHSVSFNLCCCMNLTTPVGHRILAADLIRIYYVFEWKMKVVRMSLPVECTVDNIGITSGSMWKITLHSICLMEFCGVLLYPGKWHVWILLRMYCTYVCLPAIWCEKLSHRDKIHFYTAKIPPIAVFWGHLAKLPQNPKGEFSAAKIVYCGLPMSAKDGIRLPVDSPSFITCSE